MTKEQRRYYGPKTIEALEALGEYRKIRKEIETLEKNLKSRKKKTMSETETILNKIDSLAIELQKLELIFEAYKNGHYTMAQ